MKYTSIYFCKPSYYCELQGKHSERQAETFSLSKSPRKSYSQNENQNLNSDKNGECKIIKNRNLSIFQFYDDFTLCLSLYYQINIRSVHDR